MLSAFDQSLEYRLGSQNKADALSRRKQDIDASKDVRNRQQVVLKAYNLLGQALRDIEASIVLLIVGVTGQDQYLAALTVLEANELSVKELIQALYKADSLAVAIKKALETNERRLPAQFSQTYITLSNYELRDGLIYI